MNSFLVRASTSAPVSHIWHANWARQIFGFLKVLLLAGISILAVITVLFFIMKQLPGGEPLLNQKGLTQEARDAYIQRYGLGDPLLTQFGNYLNGLFHGTFGMSMFVREGVPVESFVWDRIKWSVILGVISVVLAVILSFLFVFFVAFKINGVTDKLFTFLTALFTALPYFIFTTILLVMASGSTSFPILFAQTNFISWVLPIVAVAIPASFVDFWYIRSILVRLTNQQFVRFASIKGMSRARIIVKHLIPQSLLPMAVRLPIQLASSVTLMLLIEPIFGIPGAGQLLSSGLNAKDYNVIMAIVIVQVFLTAIAFPLQDVLARIVDPTSRRRK